MFLNMVRIRFRLLYTFLCRAYIEFSLKGKVPVQKSPLLYNFYDAESPKLFMQTEFNTK